MTTQNNLAKDAQGAYSFSTRDLIAIGFRHKRAVVMTFWGLLAGTVLATILMPADYQASTKFLVERSRIDPVVSAGHEAGTIKTDVSEEEMNSEVEILKSDDVMRQVVVAVGLHRRHSVLSFLDFDNLLGYVGFKQTDDEKIAKAARRLSNRLTITLVKKSNLINVTYSSSDPKLAAKILQALDDAYLAKDTAVHHPQGQFQFFDQQAQAYQKNLADAEGQLKDFSDQQGGVAPQLARDITLQKLNEFAANLQQTYTEIRSNEQRIDALQKQAGLTPERLTTQASATDDAQVLQGMKNTLMSLELKRTEMLTKYQPTYPLVQEVDKQIADTKQSIASEEAKPLKAETTDRNPTYAWINEELAKAKSDEAGLQARAASLKAVVEQYQNTARTLEQKGIQQQDLLRQVKTDEENYLLYQRKREEARMTDALDTKRIVNVAIAEEPVVPALQTNTRWLVLFAGLLLSLIGPVGVAFVLEYTNTSFRTPSEVFAELNIPVLAAVPHEVFAFSPNGDGNYNGNGNGHGVRTEPVFASSEPLNN
ncbi:MAG TPA: hypothetical protein VMP68_23850 [Candidatus Eisenbacteria bacterium]|nr:hypothetical protein [Candidatus Eisenbacteria bacterium]